MALQGVIRLSDVVHETLWLSGRDENYYQRFKQYAIDGFRELNRFHIADGVKTVRLIPDSNYTISFPDDFLQWIRVSIADRGEKYSLTQRGDMVNTVTLSGGYESRNVMGEGDAIGVGGNRMPGGIENVYGYFSVDYKNRRFLFLLDQLRPIYLDYVSVDIDADNDYIPVVVKPCLVAYIMWQDVYYDREAPMNDKVFKKQIYDEEVSKLRASYTFTLDTLRDALNG